MGTLCYGTTVHHLLTFDDRTLAHLQLVIGAKLRLGQPFFFSWSESIDGGGGRGSVWISPAIQLTFRYVTSHRVALNQEWITLLQASANSTTGLQVLPEWPMQETIDLPATRREPTRASAHELVRS